MAINTVEDLYRQVLGREPDAGGLAYWQQGFGETIDPNEIASFTNAAQTELANRSNAEQQILAPNLINTTGPEAKATTVNDLYTDILGRSGEQEGVDYWNNLFGNTIDANELNQFKTAAQVELDARNNTTSTGGITDLLTTGAAAADAAAKAKLGIFQTVYDSKTGREFNSPAQALQYGVTDYVTEMPLNIALPTTTQNAINTWLAKPENIGKTTNDALTSIAAQYGMTPEELRNYEIQGTIRSADRQVIGDAVRSENQGLTPDQLVAKLQAFKDKPPTTFAEKQTQNALYADYANRYANSSYNYANMGGKPQDYSLKPSDYLGTQFTGYAEPINFALSNMNQMTPEYKEMSKILTANPEINDVIDQLYKINPEHSFFNAINPKYSGGTPDSAMASNFNNRIKSLASNIERFGKDTAIQNFISQQQNLLSVLPDAQGNLGNFNQSTMANPDYRALNAIKDSYIPVADDAAWNERMEKRVSPVGRYVGEIYRDPTTGKGLGIQYGKDGSPDGVIFINQQGGAGGAVSINDPAKLLEAAYESGIPMSALSKLAKTSGIDVLNDLASGKIANTVASDDWLNSMAADKRAKTPVPEFADLEVAKLKNYQNIARDYLADKTGTATTGASTTTADNTDATTAPAALTTTAPVNPTVKLYQDVLGRTPSQEEINSWGFGDTVDAGELDRFLGAARNEAVNTMPTTGAVGNLAKQILAQGTTGKWGGQGFGSAEKNAYDMAVMLAGQGITDINQFGKATKEVPVYGTDDYGNQIETGTQTVTQFVNKATGQPINSYYDKAVGNIWGGTFAGEGSTAYGVQFTPDGKPIFYSQYGGSSSDLADWGPILALASVIPSPIQPFAIAANAAVAIDQGDVLGGIASLAGLAGFSDVAAGARIAKAVDSGEPFAIVSSIMNSPFAGNIGGTMLTDTISLRDAGNALSVANNVANENWAGALTAANQLVNSPDLNTAAAAARFIKAFETNNFAGMYTAANGFTNAMNAANKVTDKDVALTIANTVADANSAATEGTQLAALGTDTVSDVIDGLKTAGLTEDVNLPSGLQLAGVSNGTVSDAGSGLPVNISGRPIFAEDSRASKIEVPFGYRILSSSETDNKPAGSFVDNTTGAWMAPITDVSKLDTSRLQSDIDLFKSSMGDLDKVAASTSGTSDDYMADFLKSIGITSTDRLRDSGLSNQAILDMIGLSSDDVPEIEIVDKRPIKYLPTDDDFPPTPPKTDDVEEILIKDDRPINYLPTDDDFPPTTVTPPVTPPVRPPGTPPRPPTTPPVVKKPDLPEYSIQPGSQTTMSSQDPYAKIKLMEELFGTDIAYKLLGIDEKAGKSLGTGDLNALLKLLGSK